jgi:hypothetical protein
VGWDASRRARAELGEGGGALPLDNREDEQGRRHAIISRVLEELATRCLVHDSG